MPKSLLEHEAKKILKDKGIPVLDFEFCTTMDATLQAAKTIGFPVVLKIVSPQVIHKSDAGGVKLNLKTEQEVQKAYQEMQESVKNYTPGAKIQGVLVSPFVKGATELIIGAVNDPQFGPVIMVGLGGIFVEVFQDVSFGIAPVSCEEAAEMLETLKAYRIITGARGQQGLNISEITELIVKVSQFVFENPVEELDLNPVFCFDDKVLVADARILLNERL